MKRMLSFSVLLLPYVTTPHYPNNNTQLNNDAQPCISTNNLLQAVDRKISSLFYPEESNTTAYEDKATLRTLALRRLAPSNNDVYTEREIEQAIVAMITAYLLARTNDRLNLMQGIGENAKQAVRRQVSNYARHLESALKYRQPLEAGVLHDYHGSRLSAYVGKLIGNNENKPNPAPQAPGFWETLCDILGL